MSRSAPTTDVQTNSFLVHGVRHLSSSAFVLRFDRHGMVFAPGQYVTVGPADEIHMREYSVYSAPNEPYLEILVKEVEEGYVSRRLARLTPGDRVRVDGPFGFFTIDEDWRDQRFIFIATGTGISPFHAFVHSYPGIDYRLLHGVRTSAEFYDHDCYDEARLVRCVTREPGGDYEGRVTAWLREQPIDPAARYYLCGNCDMIYEAFDILQDAGVPHHHLFAEVYF